jgi:hypothetical protein
VERPVAVSIKCKRETVEGWEAKRGREHGGLSASLFWGRAITLGSWLQAVEPAHVVRPAQGSIKGLNNLHLAAAARTRRRFVVGGALADVIIVVAIHRRRGRTEQASAECELVGAMAVRQEAIVTNAMEAVRQYVEEEAAHELGSRDPHDFALVTPTLPVVLPPEADVGLIEVEPATVGDSDAMGVAREIGQDLLGTREGLFGIDDPCDRKSSGEEDEHDVLKPFIAIQRVQRRPGKGQPASRKRALPGRWQHRS